MSGNALAVALALLRTPSMRTSLRQRSLPEDVGELIELAAGEPGRVAMAAGGTGETPEQVLEAARFYVREVLLFAGADAYRVLGVTRGASPEQIKLHHRRLQHWLHPDRRGNDWESIFATRINAAWNDLRSPERRALHGARHAQAGMAGESTPAPHRVLVSRWRAAPFQGHRGLGGLALGAGVAGCVLLAVLVDRQARAPAPEWNPTRGETVDPTPPSLATTFDAAIERAGALLQSAPRPSEPAADPEVDASTVAAPGLVEPAVSHPDPAAPTPVKPMPAVARLAYIAWVEDATADSGTIAAPEPPARSTTHDQPSPLPMAAAIDAALAPAAPPPATVTPERVGLARRCGSELTRYLARDSGHVPPIWRSVAVQDAATAIRTRLDGGRVRFGAPEWRIAADHASMTTTLRRAGANAVLHAEFAWRDGLWLVERVHTENLP